MQASSCVYLLFFVLRFVWEFFHLEYGANCLAYRHFVRLILKPFSHNNKITWFIATNFTSLLLFRKGPLLILLKCERGFNNSDFDFVTFRIDC